MEHQQSRMRSVQTKQRFRDATFPKKFGTLFGSVMVVSARISVLAGGVYGMRILLERSFAFGSG